MVHFKLPYSDTGETVRIDLDEIALYRKDIVEIHGQYTVDGTQIILKNGVTVQIKHDIKDIDKLLKDRNMLHTIG